MESHAGRAVKMRTITQVNRDEAKGHVEKLAFSVLGVDYYKIYRRSRDLSQASTSDNRDGFSMVRRTYRRAYYIFQTNLYEIQLMIALLNKPHKQGALQKLNDEIFGRE